jgi:hypothetical protein
MSIRQKRKAVRGTSSLKAKNYDFHYFELRIGNYNNNNRYTSDMVDKMLQLL